LVFDVSNACLGFSNGLTVLANLIETGAVKAGLVVACETMTQITDATLRSIADQPTLDREQFLRLLPALTLGSGAAAVVLCHESIASKRHRLIGAASRSATQLNDLCRGSMDACWHAPGLGPLMHTEATEMLEQVAPLARRTWDDCRAVLRWSDEQPDHIVTHQVGRVVDTAMFDQAGLDERKSVSIYRDHGNQVSAALPITLAHAVEERGFERGDHVLLIGFGSGLVASTTAISW
jgi:3-oxoacyl-[acyl-carrier-protein] synthase-3